MKKHWYDYLWIWTILYFALGFFNILFAWLGMIDFLVPLFIAIFGGNKAFCNRYCGRGQLLGKCGKCSRNQLAPRWVSSKWFRYGFLVFFLCQEPLVAHFAEDVELAVAVTLRAVAFLSLILVDTLGIGIEDGRVIGNTDETGALRRGQGLQFLAEILRRSGFDAVAASAQIDLIEIILHNQVFIVFPFKELGAEDLHHLSLNRYGFFLRQVLDQLLCNGGTTKFRTAAEEPSATVSRLLLKKANITATIQPATALSVDPVLLNIAGNVIAANTEYGT